MSKVPKASLELDDDHHPGHSVADAAVADGVEDEKCVVSQYRTTLEQKIEFQEFLEQCDRESIPIEWVIDIADESNGWFYATAYSYNDVTHMLHVMVPDKENPTFDGEVQLDHRTVHFIECVDQRSAALYNKIVRDSVIRIKWDVEWFEDEMNDTGEPVEGAGQWIQSSARYYLRIVNQLLVEDQAGDEDGRGFVIVTADDGVKLVECHKNKGIEDFNRLVLEKIVDSSPEAYEAAQRDALIERAETTSGRDNDADRDQEREREREHKDRDRDRDRERDRERGESRDRDRDGGRGSTTRKLADYARSLRDNISDIIEDREIKKRDELEIADLFNSFILNGDLEQGLQVMQHFENVRSNRRGDDDEERVENAIDDAKLTVSKLERALLKAVRNGSGEDKHDDADKLHSKIKKLEKEINEMKIRR